MESPLWNLVEKATKATLVRVLGMDDEALLTRAHRARGGMGLSKGEASEAASFSPIRASKKRAGSGGMRRRVLLLAGEFQ